MSRNYKAETFQSLAREAEQFGHSHARNGEMRTSDLLFRISRALSWASQRMETREGGDSEAAPSRSDDSPVGNANAPETPSIQHLQSQIISLREALTPFADYADFFDDCEAHPNGCPDDAKAGEVVDLTVGDFRRARDAYRSVVA